MVKPGIIKNAMAKLSRPGVLFKRKNINNGSGVNNNNSNEGEKTKETVLGRLLKRRQSLSKAVEETAARFAALEADLAARVGGSGGDCDGDNDGGDKTEGGGGGGEIKELFLNAFLRVIFERLTSPQLLDFATREGVGSQLNKLKKTVGLINAEIMLTGGHGAAKMWLYNLEALAYDTEDILDEFATEALTRNLIDEHLARTAQHGSGGDGDGSGDGDGDGSGGDGSGGDNDGGDKTEGGGGGGGKMEPKVQHYNRNRFSYHGGDENGYPVGQLHRCYYEKPNVCSIITISGVC